jgi:hypothetical protein
MQRCTRATTRHPRAFGFAANSFVAVNSGGHVEVRDPASASASLSLASAMAAFGSSTAGSGTASSVDTTRPDLNQVLAPSVSHE